MSLVRTIDIESSHLPCRFARKPRDLFGPSAATFHWKVRPPSVVRLLLRIRPIDESNTNAHPPTTTVPLYYSHVFQRRRPFRTFITNNNAPTIYSISRAGHSSPPTFLYNGTLYLCFGGGGQQPAKCANSRCPFGMVRLPVPLHVYASSVSLPCDRLRHRIQPGARLEKQHLC